MYSCASGNEVAYLKTNKVMEVVTTSIKPLPFYLGVTLSIGLTGLIQLVGIVVIIGGLSIYFVLPERNTACG